MIILTPPTEQYFKGNENSFFHAHQTVLVLNFSLEPCLLPNSTMFLMISPCLLLSPSHQSLDLTVPAAPDSDNQSAQLIWPRTLLFWSPSFTGSSLIKVVLDTRTWAMFFFTWNHQSLYLSSYESEPLLLVKYQVLCTGSKENPYIKIRKTILILGNER